MYNILLKDGKIIEVNATEMVCSETYRTIKLFYEEKMVARINMDNIVGWIHSDYTSDL